MFMVNKRFIYSHSIRARV